MKSKDPMIIEITPLDTLARDMPFGMINDVCKVLCAHGLNVTAPELKGAGLVEVMGGLVSIIDAIPCDNGGRRVADSRIDKGDRTEKQEKVNI